MPKFALQHVQSQGRTTYSGNIGGNAIRIVVGYDIAVDKYRFHLYIQRGPQNWEKVDIANPLANTEEDALDIAEGFAEHVA